MRESIDVAGSEHKTGAELERIDSQFVLAMSGRFGAFSGDGIVLTQKMKDRCRLQTRSAIRFALLVNEQRKADAGIFAENACVIHVTEADSGEVGAFCREFPIMFAQLRDVFAAEDSTVVPEKDDHCRTLGPQRSELSLAAGRVRKRDRRKPRAERKRHYSIVRRALRIVNANCGGALS